ncbi:hypothetical protein M569_05606, partial [Genlisea aurea]
KVYVGLPLDTVSTSNGLNHERAIAVGLKALKLLGVDGVELPIWWGVVENEAPSRYDWSSYLSVVETVQKLGLQVHASLYFNGSKESKIPLPSWVQKIASSDLYFKDRSGRRYMDCLSLSVDQLPVLDGKTPLQVYGRFCESFKSTFSSFLGSTITGVSIGLGPDGELKYPSTIVTGKDRNGGGEFQCYDENLLRNLKHHAEVSGNPLWGLGGPHDASGYGQSPISSGFFAENGGSWDTPYGDFFLGWYSDQLIRHGDRMLSLLASAFRGIPVSLCGKIPLMHSFYSSRSHPSELTAGFYNTANRDGYDAVAEVFSRHSCTLVVPGFDLSDEKGGEPRSSPEALLAQIRNSCTRNGCEVSGENSSSSSAKGSFEMIKKNLSGDHPPVDVFTYQRMGAHFFSPEHFPDFTRFVRSLTQPEQSPDDSPAAEE